MNIFLTGPCHLSLATCAPPCASLKPPLNQPDLRFKQRHWRLHRVHTSQLCRREKQRATERRSGTWQSWQACPAQSLLFCRSYHRLSPSRLLPKILGINEVDMRYMGCEDVIDVRSDSHSRRCSSGHRQPFMFLTTLSYCTPF